MAYKFSLLPPRGACKQKIQPLLYKYLSYGSAKAMLENSNIQFTRARKLNDPFDCHPGLIDLSTETPETLEVFRKIRWSQYICCLSEKFDSFLMWSYYNNHEGICIGLDIKKVESALRQSDQMFNFLPPSRVNYRGSVVKLNYSKNSEQALRHMIYTKTSKWKHEREVRMSTDTPNSIEYLYMDNNEKGDHLTGDYWRPPIDSECFAAIYLGVNIDRNDLYVVNKEYVMNEKGEIFKKSEISQRQDTPRRDVIVKLARKLNPNIKIYQMHVNQDAFELNCIEI